MHNHLTTSTNHVPGSLACALCTPITVSVRLAATSFWVSCDSGRDCQDCVGRRALHVPLSQPRRAACPGASDDQSGVCPKATGQVKVEAEGYSIRLLLSGDTACEGCGLEDACYPSCCQKAWAVSGSWPSVPGNRPSSFSSGTAIRSSRPSQLCSMQAIAESCLQCISITRCLRLVSHLSA